MISKISLALCVLLSAAVIYLFATRTKPMVTSSGEEVQIAPALQTEGGPKATVLAYVDSDSLNGKYKFIIDKKKKLENDYKNAEEKVKRELQLRQIEAQKWEAYLQRPDVTEADRAQAQQDVMRMENEMADIEKREADRLANDQDDLQKQLFERVNKFLETYSKQRGIDYVLLNDKNFKLILYGNNAYNVTDEVVAALNAEYEAEKASGKK